MGPLVARWEDRIALPSLHPIPSHPIAALTMLPRISEQDFARLARIERKLRRLGEEECNGQIQVGEENGHEVYRRYYRDQWGSYTSRGEVIPDPYRQPLAKAAKIAANCGGLIYHQPDPRGASLYFYRESDLGGRKIDECCGILALPCCGTYPFR